MLKTLQIGNSTQKLLFLPGGNIDIKCYLPLLTKLSENYTVIAVDLIQSNTKNIFETKEELEKYITEQTESLIVIGHSFGADIVKAIQSGKIKTKVLFNSSIFNPNYNTPTIILKTLSKSILVPISYPQLFTYYTKANLYLLTNLILFPIKTLRHIKQAILNITKELIVTEYNPDEYVIVANKDEYFPLSLATKYVLSNTKVVNGNHDWIMQDVEQTAKLITDLVNS